MSAIPEMTTIHRTEGKALVAFLKIVLLFSNATDNIYLELIKMKFNSTGTVCSSHTAIESVRELHSNALFCCVHSTYIGYHTNSARNQQAEGILHMYPETGLA